MTLFDVDTDVEGLGRDLLAHPERLSDDVVLWVDGRVLPQGDPECRTLVGWHRAGGAVVVGLGAGTASEALLVETMRVAETTAAWPSDRWDAALGATWMAADPALMGAVAARWNLPRSGPWRTAEWCRSAWDGPRLAGRARIGVVAPRVPERLRRAIDWVEGGRSEAAAWEVAPGDPPRLERVAGKWSRAEALPASADAPVPQIPPAEGAPGAQPVAAAEPATAPALIARVERLCRVAGARIHWNEGGWMRADGYRRSLRAFPREDGVDLQLAGADEGTLVGLRYRTGAPVSLAPPPGAPPGVHLRATSLDHLGPPVEALLGAWLAAPEDGNGEAAVRRNSRARKRNGPGPGRPDR